MASSSFLSLHISLPSSQGPCGLTPRSSALGRTPPWPQGHGVGAQVRGKQALGMETQSAPAVLKLH